MFERAFGGGSTHLRCSLSKVAYARHH
jgi:hypothetical protein